MFTYSERKKISSDSEESQQSIFWQMTNVDFRGSTEAYLAS